MLVVLGRMNLMVTSTQDAVDSLRRGVLVGIVTAQRTPALQSSKIGTRLYHLKQLKLNLLLNRTQKIYNVY